MISRIFFDRYGDWRLPFQLLAIVVGGIALALAFGAGITLLLSPLAERACIQSWDPSFQPKFTLVSGCTIVADGRRIPADQFRAVNPQ